MKKAVTWRSGSSLAHDTWPSVVADNVMFLFLLVIGDAYNLGHALIASWVATVTISRLPDCAW